MQANNDIKNLFEGFENEFDKGDWSAIEGRVLENNAKYKAANTKFKIGLSLGVLACVTLGLIHFNTTKSELDSNDMVAEAIVLTDQKEEIPSETVQEKSNEEYNNDSPKESSETAAPAVAVAAVETQEQPINEVQKIELPKFVLNKTNYCIGEKLDFIASNNNLSFKVGNKKLNNEEVRSYRFSKEGNVDLEVLENGKAIQNYKLNAQAPMARIGYKKNYEINNQSVQFSALNAPESAQIRWYIDSEPIANANSFEHTFASRGMYSIKMIVSTSSGCKDSTVKAVRILRGYNLMATSVYNPEKGTWMPLGLKKKGLSFKLRIVNQDGKTIFTSTNPEVEWDGSADKGSVSNGDLFYWVAQVTDSSGKISEYGNSLLINSELK